MGMKKFPQLTQIGDGTRCWAHVFDGYAVQVCVPQEQELAAVINFGFKAPYLLVFDEKRRDLAETAALARAQGWLELAQRYSTAVVFVTPTGPAGWDGAPASLYTDLIAQSRIHQYYRDGVVTSRDRFSGAWGECYIRGAIFRTIIYGRGRAADYIARNLLQTVQGQYLWGPGEITPAAVVLEGLSIVPQPQRRDIPVVSVGNTNAVNEVLSAACDHLQICTEPRKPAEHAAALVCWKRWCGQLQMEPDLTAEGMVEEPGVETVPTSADNFGDDRNTPQHRIGYVAYYRRGLLDNGPVPTVLVFHGGGDSAFYISYVSGWYRVAQRGGFLMIAVENHLNSTATEMVALLEKLKEKYPIDSRRVYASGFSMGGCKSWDMYQEYPQVFAALAPMSATFEVGLNVFGRPAPVEINRDVPVPLFYAGGEITPLPELPFQAQKCFDRMRYVFEVNRVKKPCDISFEDQSGWENPIWGVNGDTVEHIDDPERGSVLTIHRFESGDGIVRTAFASISGQGHECREHTCEHAWQFMKQFVR